MFLLYANDFSFNIREAEYVYVQTIECVGHQGGWRRGE